MDLGPSVEFAKDAMASYLVPSMLVAVSCSHVLPMLNLPLHKEPLSYASIKEKDETVSSLIETFTVEKVL